ncbi:MAG: hypothetical protein Q9163_005566, partial [Psora crenata]
ALNRATRKNLLKLWVVHEKAWVRVLVAMFATVVSPKFRKKAVHDRRKLRDIYVPYASGKRAFGVREPLPTSSSGEHSRRLPRVLREATSFVTIEPNIKNEGLFRVSARAQTVEILKEAYDRGQKYIVWRDGKTLATWPHVKEGYGDVAIRDDELEQLEGYDTHTAAALIKLWYMELREPVFPQASYQALRRFYGDPDTLLEATTLLQLLAPGVEYSPIHETGRSILILHLLPLLSRVAEHAEHNKMTPSNLAICFAPSLLCGPDPFEDVQISVIIRRILTAMIEHWTTDLAPALGLTNEKFEESLTLPDKVEDREDPLEENASRCPSAQGIEGQISGITLIDNGNNTNSSDDDNDEEEEEEEEEGGEMEENGEERPPLPPRERAATLASNVTTGNNNNNNNNNIDLIRRKPAPPLRTPPRYSMIILDQAADLAQINGTQFRRPRNTVKEESHEDVEPEQAPAEHRRSTDTLPQYEERASSHKEAIGDRGMIIPRKPVGKGKRALNEE